MTKMVRIENADTSEHRVVVEVWSKGSDGRPDALVRVAEASYPTALVSEHVWDGQYLVVREAIP